MRACFLARRPCGPVRPRKQGRGGTVCVTRARMWSRGSVGPRVTRLRPGEATRSRPSGFTVTSLGSRPPGHVPWVTRTWTTTAPGTPSTMARKLHRGQNRDIVQSGQSMVKEYKHGQERTQDPKQTKRKPSSISGKSPQQGGVELVLGPRRPDYCQAQIRPLSLPFRFRYGGEGYTLYSLQDIYPIACNTYAVLYSLQHTVVSYRV
jgi:hypothetical protein